MVPSCQPAPGGRIDRSREYVVRFWVVVGGVASGGVGATGGVVAGAPTPVIVIWLILSAGAALTVHELARRQHDRDQQRYRLVELYAIKQQADPRLLDAMARARSQELESPAGRAPSHSRRP